MSPDELRRFPLDALRGFEAAARFGQFNLAAAELHVTSSAISHQIRSLESRLGTDLFERSGASMQLTTAGSALLADVRPALDLLRRGIRAVGATNHTAN